MAPRHAAIARARRILDDLGPYLALTAVFAVLALVLALGWTGWQPASWTEWLMVVGLVPAGVGGALIGDRIGLWLKDQGIGRQ